MQRVKLLKNWITKKAGEIISVSDKSAEHMIQTGYASDISDEQFFKEILPEEDTLNLKNPVISDDGHLVEARIDNKLKIKKKKIDAIALLHLPIDNYLDNAKKFYDVCPYFYDKSGMFMVWNEILSKYEEWSDIKIMDTFDIILGFKGQTISSSIKNNTLEAMKRIGLRKQPKDAPKKWIQFKDKAYSIKSGNIYDVTPDYFFCNPIPWEFGDTEDTPTMDKLFGEWVGEKYVPTLYELIAYCCYTDYPIQLLFCLIGSGRNGKGCFLKIIDKFIGKDNVISTSLDLLSGNNKSRFESSKLYKKLVALVGETNFGILNNTSLIKQLTGGDKIGFEKKGKDPFDDYSYAKIIIASNSLPTTQDTSDGFFRRWFIIDFQNEFPEGKDITKTIPEYEYNNLAKKVCKILQNILETGTFTNQGEIDQRKKNYIFASNPIQLFINNCCVVDDSVFCLANELYIAYLHYLRIHKKRRVKNPEFKAALEDEGFWIEKTSKKVYSDEEDYNFVSSRWIDGLKLKDNWKDYANYGVFASIPTSTYTRENEVGKKGKTSQTAQEEAIEDTETRNSAVLWDEKALVYHHCAFPTGDSMCGNTPCNEFEGRYYCKEHFEKVQDVTKTP